MTKQAKVQFADNHLTIVGEVMSANVRQLIEEMTALLSKQQSQVTVDLAKLEKYDSAICLLLVQCFRLTKHKNIALDCINIPDSLCNIFKVYDLDQVLPFLDQA